MQTPTACDGLSTGSCSVGSVFSENELHPCSVTGVAWWPLNQHLSPWSTEIRLQSGRTSAPTDDLLFYLEQQQLPRSVGTWLLELITHFEESRNFAPSPSSNLGLYCVSGSFQTDPSLTFFCLIPWGSNYWYDTWTSLACMMEAVHLSPLNPTPSPLQLPVIPLHEPPAVYFILLGSPHWTQNLPYHNSVFPFSLKSFISNDA